MVAPTLGRRKTAAPLSTQTARQRYESPRRPAIPLLMRTIAKLTAPPASVPTRAAEYEPLPGPRAPTWRAVQRVTSPPPTNPTGVSATPLPTCPATRHGLKARVASVAPPCAVARPCGTSAASDVRIAI